MPDYAASLRRPPQTRSKREYSCRARHSSAAWPIERTNRNLVKCLKIQTETLPTSADGRLECTGRRRLLMWWTAPAPGNESDRVIVVNEASTSEERSHAKVTTIGLDIAKNVFQVHGIDAGEKVIVRKQLRRSQIGIFQELPPCLVGMEACASSHYWARELRSLATVRLMPAKDVKAYVKRNKNDATDAEAICEAVDARPCGSCKSSRSSSRRA